jgi:ATP-dependent Clp protease ATP-binding subunit ClpC
MKTLFKEPLFEPDGKLRIERLDDGAREVLLSIQGALGELGRRMFLPLDLVIALLERGHEELARLIALGTDGVVPPVEVINRLRVLAREIEEEDPGSLPQLDRTSFSRGFTRILEEAWDQAQGRGSTRFGEADLLRSVRWRVEAVESASVRWAVRRLSEGRGDELFDERGLLRLVAFDETSQGILRGAMKIAASHGTSFLGTPHLVAMMASVRESVLWRSARARGLEPGRLREELIRLIGSKPDAIPEFLIGRKTLTPRMIRMLQWAVQNAGESAVGESDLVEAFLDDGGSSLELVQALGLEEECRTALGEPRVLADAEPIEAALHFVARRHASPTLDMLGRDLTREAMEGRLPSIVGRERELQRVFNVLMRQEQRNPLLTGEAGVGKTALAVGMAEAIASGRGPRSLQGFRVIEINGASLMSGTSYRGDLEARIKSLIEEASQDVILFIDEAHAVFAPRSGSNTPAEVPNHFKSALASGTIAVVGATTQDEYHRWFEQDPALKRRFERIEVAEPDEVMVKIILETLVPALEESYGVKVAADAVESAISLSQRYLPEQRLPDKAKKLLMDACIDEANRHGDVVEVRAEAVARQVHLKTAIPMDRLLKGEISWWVGLEERLQDSVLGQDAAMRSIARVLVSSRLKNARRRRPLSVLGFLGPAGVGKATAAAALAREVFSDERALIRLDMTDFQESHALSRLIGSPPGYVGYEDGDMLVTPLRRRPASVVLFEDFDRAHPRIQDRLLRLIEEGELADTRGHRADATNAIFILTVELSTAKAGPIGFGGERAGAQVDEDVQGPLIHRLRHRLDGLITFTVLSSEYDEGTRSLLDMLIAEFVENTEREYQIDVVIGHDLREELRRQGIKATTAQDVEAVVDRLLLNPTADALLAGDAAGELRLEWDAENQCVFVGDQA